MELHTEMNIKHFPCAKKKHCEAHSQFDVCCLVKVLSACNYYLMDNELMGAIWQSPAILLHQRNKGVAKQFLLSLVFSCQTTTHYIESKIHQHRENKQKLTL